jgi:hypothetical protein
MTLGFDKGELRLYFGHVLRLLSPSHEIRLIDTYKRSGGTTVEPGTLQGWSDEDAALVVTEGRRQLDSLSAQFEQIRDRGKFLFTTLIAFIAVVVGLSPKLTHRSAGLFVPWYVGLVFIAVGLLGAAAVFVVTAELGSVNVVLLSLSDPTTTRIERELATAYPVAVKRSHVAVQNRFTILRDSLWFGIIGAVIEFVVWLALGWAG